MDTTQLRSEPVSQPRNRDQPIRQRLFSWFGHARHADTDRLIRHLLRHHPFLRHAVQRATRDANDHRRWRYPPVLQIAQRERRRCSDTRRPHGPSCTTHSPVRTDNSPARLICLLSHAGQAILSRPSQHLQERLLQRIWNSQETCSHGFTRAKAFMCMLLRSRFWRRNHLAVPGTYAVLNATCESFTQWTFSGTRYLPFWWSHPQHNASHQRQPYPRVIHLSVQDSSHLT